MTRLYPEIRWVNAFRIADPGLAISHQPVLLAPMATMLRDRTGVLSLSTASMRSIMDSIGSRLDEARDTGRYHGRPAGVSRSARHVLGPARNDQVGRQAPSTRSTPARRQRHDVLRSEAGLAAPLKGMGTAFSSSLLGLAGSLDPRLPRAAGEPRAQPLLQRAGGMAVGHHRADARHATSQPIRSPASCPAPSSHAARGRGSVDAARRPVDGRRASAGRRGGGEEPVRELAAGVNQLVTPDARRAEGRARVGRRAGLAAVGSGERAEGARRQYARAKG